MYSFGNLNALPIYICGTMSVLVTKSKELVKDATYGTSNTGEQMKNLDQEYTNIIIHV